MKSLKEKLTAIVGDAFAESGYDASYGEVTVSDRPDLAQFQCNGAMPASGTYDAKPREIAERVVEALSGHDAFEEVGVAGPGFINLTLTDAYLTEHLAEQAADERLGVAAIDEPEKVVLDYGGPNVAKPMHVGHLRAAIIGDSLKRLARFLGHDVVGDVHLGDWGLQMGMLIVELERRQPDLPYFDPDFTGPYPDESPVDMDDLEEMYPAASSRAQEDSEAMEAARRATLELQEGRAGYRALWQHFVDVSVRELKAEYAQLDVSFDLWLGESDVQDRIPDLIERLQEQDLAYESQGALVVDVAEPDDRKELPPLMLRKSDGAVLYGTTDLATIDYRVQELDADTIVYVVDNRQADHFEQVFRAARRAGIAPPSVHLEHAGFGTMNGKDGKPYKTREGGVMRLRDLLETVEAKARERMAELEMAEDYDERETAEIVRCVGIATLKYADLMNHRTKDYVFDLERFSSFEGRTGPYLLYTAVRTKSILRKAEERGIAPGTIVPPASDHERAVFLKIADLPDILNLALTGRAPNHICEFGHSLATLFNRFYHEHHILSEEDDKRRGSWLALSELVVRVLERTLNTLGISVPERM